MAFTIHTQVRIQAPATRVWNILMDFDSYLDWNPFIKSIQGQAVLGAKLKALIHLPGNKPMTFKPTVMSLVNEKELSWLGHLGIKGIFDGHHRFVLKSISPNETVLEHSEEFRGILIPFFRKNLEKNTQEGFEAMNQALKQRAERL
ncbi:SRPBCC domain-containing protein [Cytophagales bacterium LB-30]|uniref:SRPBCC domain-containing protein n=1 Tax=Shiella aurantiaca TaxID=3058365 RepID=A0ABT8F1N0_9BACT|nr:SRPBCC domain-containing protein [Shiella aurantiaca]MDN4164356.1 SRPBCC domain-containing protein [Shiella aurantiaca]